MLSMSRQWNEITQVVPSVRRCLSTERIRILVSVTVLTESQFPWRCPVLNLVEDLVADLRVRSGTADADQLQNVII